MSDFSMYHQLGQGEQDPSNPNRSTQPAPPQFSPPIAGQQYQQGAAYGSPPTPGQQQYYGGQPGSVPPQGQPYGAPGQEYAQSPGFQSQDSLAAQMGGMSLGDGQGTARRKKKDRHAYHQVEATGSSQAFNGIPRPARMPPPS
ncbi:sec23/sec24 trunk domain-containing protein [Colletotrichum higginsianum]|nr:sec23/sec24 trunk domain-containing protein [Colletotrichum higginsianum]